VAESKKYEARNGLDEVRKKISEAGGIDHASALIAIIRDGGGRYDPTLLHDATRELADVEASTQRALEVWTKTCASCELAIAQRRGALEAAKLRVPKEVVAVIKEEGLASLMLDLARDLQRQMLHTFAVLSSLSVDGMLPEKLEGPVREFLSYPLGRSLIDVQRTHPAALKLRDSLAALQRDADAPVPFLESQP
jgi:hypothetical protein